MVIQGPKELILAGFAALALTGDSVMQEALKEWDLKEDGVQVTVGEPDTPLAVAILGRGGTNWKWYEDYADVQAHAIIFDHFRQLYDDFPNELPYLRLTGAFARIGEDDDDIKTDYWGNDPHELLSIRRSIDCPYDSAVGADLRQSSAQA
jgi:hypothetical protein